MATRKAPTRKELVEKLMAASVALGELHEAVGAFEKHGGRELMARNADWLPFLELLDQMQDDDGRLQGLGASVFSEAFSLSEEAHDAKKARRARK
ncbi:MAG: hypothetical protein ACOZQL_41060 [Myxococcota bacterium]